MAIPVKEAAVYFALAESARQNGKKVAVRFAPDGTVTAIGYDDAATANDAKSAIINVVQNASRGSFLATSYDPTAEEKSLGMCIMQSVRAIYFTNAQRSIIHYLKANNNKNPTWKSNQFKQVDTDKLTALEALGTTEPLTWLQQIAANPPKAPVGDQESIAANAARMYGTFTDAGRFTHYTGFPDLTLPAGLPSPNSRVDNPQRHEIFNKLAWAIVGEAAAQRGPQGKYPNGHHIGSVLRGPKDEILGWGINTGSGSGNSTLHGEVNLILNYRKHANNGAAIGEGLANEKKPIVYSTLEPCHMCAGIIAGGGDHLQCYYSQSDKGIKFNALERQYNDSSQQVIDTIPNISSSANRMGRSAGSAYGYEERKLISLQQKKKKPAVTDLLNRKIDQGILYAVEDYFDIVPRLGTAERTTWDASPEKIIWDAGLKLLHHINPGVVAKWEARTHRYVAGIIP